jgi:hypothetical protein
MLTTADAALPVIAAGDRELKFTLPGSRVALARRMLEASCRPDQEYPTAYVWTIYYDTPHLASLREKINSEYLKLKIRLRWYAEIEQPPSGPAFIEVKRRVGARRDKVRVRAPYAAEELATWDLQDGRLRSLPLLLRAQGIKLQDLWYPVLLIRYRRDRFVEPISRARVNLDSGIAGVAVNPSFVSTSDPSSLGLAILEVKGRHQELPSALRALLLLGARKRSISKFLAVHRHVTRAIF